MTFEGFAGRGVAADDFAGAGGADPERVAVAGDAAGFIGIGFEFADNLAGFEGDEGGAGAAARKVRRFIWPGYYRAAKRDAKRRKA